MSAPKSIEEAEAERDELLTRAGGYALQALMTFSDEELADARTALARAEAFGWALDPTGYRKSRDARERARELYEALHLWRAAVARMVDADIAAAQREGKL